MAILFASRSTGVELSSTAKAADSSTDRIDYSAIKRVAQKLALQAYSPSDPLCPELQNLDYDRYRLIAFRHDQALWRDQYLPYWVEFYHRGFIFRDKIDVSTVTNGAAQAVPFDPALFQYRGELGSLKAPADLGFAGFRLLCRLPSRPQFQEFCSFLGASYFRAICANQVYGASARGLAVNIGLKEPEEFPAFRKFWINEPSSPELPMRVWALLDSPSVTGAYQFNITAGHGRTDIDVASHLCFRKSVPRLGIAPLTSMWMWDAARQPATDRRPHVHDSDGLLLHSAQGEWLWRPLDRPDEPRVSRFPGDVRGFGLMQRERDLDCYRDYEAQYHLRPNIWVTPHEPWKGGAVELLELPSNSEGIDNIAAYWNPSREIKPGDSLELNYRLTFSSDEPMEHTGGAAVKTVVKPVGNDVFEFCVDWSSKALGALVTESQVEPVINSTAGRIVDSTCTKHADGTWQMKFRLRQEGDAASDLRAFVRHGKDTLSETWSYLWN